MYCSAYLERYEWPASFDCEVDFLAVCQNSIVNSISKNTVDVKSLNSPAHFTNRNDIGESAQIAIKNICNPFIILEFLYSLDNALIIS